MYRYAIIGFGGLGRIHLSNLLKISKKRGDIELVAICGTTRENAQKQVEINLGNAPAAELDFSKCKFYNDYSELIENEQIDFAFSVLPTYLHDKAALMALKNNIHLFSEKPMALSVESCEQMIKTANDHNKILMIGHHLRFDPVYKQLLKYVKDKTFGEVRSAQFTRNSQLPVWTWNNWILDAKKSGGCVLDMHIHDVDLVNILFGMPKSVMSSMTSSVVERESILTLYDYEKFTVISRADWSLPQKYPFSAECKVDFERASVCINNGEITVYTDNDSYNLLISEEDAFYNEAYAFVSAVADKKQIEESSPESVLKSVKLAMAEIESSEKGKKIYL